MEDSKIQRRAQSNHIIKVLSKLEGQRMPFEGVQISKSLQKIPFFTRFFECKSEPFISMCVSSELKQFSQGQEIYISQGCSKQIYIVLEGSVRIQSLCGDYESMINEFGQFGQTEIIFGIAERQQNAKAMSICKCMAIKSSEMMRICKKQPEIQKCLHFLEVNNYFQSLKRFQKQKLSLLMEKKMFSSNQTLLQKGQKPTAILFVVNGRIFIVKNVPIKTDQLSKNQSKAKCSKDLVIDTIQEMASYGEYQLINNKSTQITMIAQSSGIFYSLQYSQVVESSHPIIRKLSERAMPYPSDEELQFIFEVESRLKNHQEKIHKKFLQEEKRRKM